MAIAFGLQGDLGIAALFIIGGAVFDFFDGMTARALGISGPIGKELDSLADIVSFGVAPSVLAFQVSQTICSIASPDDTIGFHKYSLLFVAMLMAAFSALRLAKFNCDERQHLSFIGLPTPANAIFWIGISQFFQIPSIAEVLCREYVSVLGYCWSALVLLMSYLLICELPMFSLKLKPGHNGFAENKARYIFLGLTAVILIVSLCLGFQWFCASPAAIILLYIILSVIDSKCLRN